MTEYLETLSVESVKRLRKSAHAIQSMQKKWGDRHTCSQIDLHALLFNMIQGYTALMQASNIAIRIASTEYVEEPAQTIESLRGAGVITSEQSDQIIDYINLCEDSLSSKPPARKDTLIMAETYSNIMRQAADSLEEFIGNSDGI